MRNDNQQQKTRTQDTEDFTLFPNCAVEYIHDAAPIEAPSVLIFTTDYMGRIQVTGI